MTQINEDYQDNGETISMFDENHRRSTVRFEDGEGPEVIDNAQEYVQKRREDKRKSSVFKDGILFSNYQEDIGIPIDTNNAKYRKMSAAIGKKQMSQNQRPSLPGNSGT